MGTATARFGAAFDRALVYVLGGFAWEHERLANPGTDTTPAIVLFQCLRKRNMGRQSAPELTGNWSAFVQYNYMSFGRRASVFTDLTDTFPPFTEIIRDDIQVIKVGLNYRFH